MTIPGTAWLHARSGHAALHIYYALAIYGTFRCGKCNVLLSLAVSDDIGPYTPSSEQEASINTVENNTSYHYYCVPGALMTFHMFVVTSVTLM